MPAHTGMPPRRGWPQMGRGVAELPVPGTLIGETPVTRTRCLKCLECFGPASALCRNPHRTRSCGEPQTLPCAPPLLGITRFLFAAGRQGGQILEYSRGLEPRSSARWSGDTWQV